MSRKVSSVKCSNCSRDTDHQLIFDESVTEREFLLDQEYNAWHSDGHRYTLFKCLGCKNIVMRKIFQSTDIFPEDYQGDTTYITWHPPVKLRPEPKWIRSKYISREEREMNSEILVALNSSCHSLAAMGMRALLDMFMTRRVGDKGSFNKKIIAMVSCGFISKSQEEIIVSAIDVGSAASHRGHIPDLKTLTFVMDVIDTLLQQDVMTSDVPTIKSKTPIRPKAVSKKKQQAKKRSAKRPENK